MPDVTIPEPGDKAVVGWIDPNGDLYAVFHRTDAYADGAEDLDRWYNADLYAGNDADGPKTWLELLGEMDGMRGPYALNFGELLGGAE
jgi:hypothetical protein